MIVVSSWVTGLDPDPGAAGTYTREHGALLSVIVNRFPAETVRAVTQCQVDDRY
jgi:hypothetical protein